LNRGRTNTLTDSIRKRHKKEDSASFVQKFKKRSYTDLLHFSTRKHNHMNIGLVNIGFFTGFKKIKQRRISFILGYLRMILWQILPAISIKHWILSICIRSNLHKQSPVLKGHPFLVLSSQISHALNLF
jgi:hypothetical protein